jgi:hypothetical protein
VPHQVFSEYVVDSGEITVGKCGIDVPDASDVRMLGHGFPS